MEWSKYDEEDDDVYRTDVYFFDNMTKYRIQWLNNTLITYINWFHNI